MQNKFIENESIETVPGINKFVKSVYLIVDVT